ncbi:MAG: class II fructose-1,6-bisphosphate aldolase [Candidatus Gracilibacteria bacterium]|nr:class II fructose-1,6-bisphosphate aldolase [Candidatus Gracilibacteria bacterium]MDD5178733.1 class II fructose-1,6-bisphosphate aldolase [Candidatus Gracilibacteria bacterium]
MLTTSTELFKKAIAGKYAIGAFNVNNLEIIQGIMEGAKEKQSPVILQVSAGARKYAGSLYLRRLIEAAAEGNPEIPIVFHLDHGEDFEVCKDCIDNGFTSVMIDGSKHSYEDNVALTKKVVDYAHSKGVVVEGELGRLEGMEDNIKVEAGQGSYTDPQQALDFVKKTGVDSLAVAIGTSHGAYKFAMDANPKLDFERCQAISDLVKIPLVLHGASSVLQNFVEEINAYGGAVKGSKGVPEAMISEATKHGVAKVNIDTDIRLAMTAATRKSLKENPDNFDVRKFLGAARTAVTEMVKHKIDILGSAGKI